MCRTPIRASNWRSFADAPGPLIAATAACPIESVPDAPQPIVECTSFSAAFSLSVHTDTVSCVPKRFMEIDWIRERMVAIDVEETIPAVSVGVLTRRDALNSIACDYLIHCFVEAVRRHDRATLLWR